MSTDYYQATEERPRRSLLGPLLLLLFAFAGGATATVWLLSSWSDGASMLGIQPEPAPVVRQAAPVSPPVQAPARPQPATAPAATAAPDTIVIDPEISRRVQRLEQRIGFIDTQARTAAGNADRAEGLLIAFAARRALDRGVGLGYLEALLRQRFGATQPQAVGVIITASRQPVTLQELQDGLQDFAPELTGGGPNQSWWTALQSEVRGLITIRRAGTPSPVPAERFNRAARRLEAGQVEVALAEVMRMPGHPEAAAWVSAASRYVQARRALDTIETAALLEPYAPQPTPRQAAGQQQPRTTG
jgi:hypothetical protein